MLDEQKCAFDCICVQETWLPEHADCSLLALDGYSLISQGFSSSTHGGVAIYVRLKYHFSVLHSVRNDAWEALFVGISGKSGCPPLVIGNIYRPPNNNNENLSNFINEITQCFSMFQHPHGKCIVTGDFNIDLLKINEKPQFREYFNTITSLGYTPRLTFPTRLTDNNGTLIDNILTNFLESHQTVSGIMTTKISDHQPCFLSIHLEALKDSFPNALRPEKKKFIFIKTKPNNLNEIIREELRNINLMSCINTDPLCNPNITYDKIESIITNIIDKHTVLKKVRDNKYKHRRSDWITRGIMKSIKFRDKLYHKLKRSSPDSQEHYIIKTNLKTYNKIFKKSIKDAKALYYHKKFYQFREDPKKTWKTINSVLNRNKSKESSIEQLSINGRKIDSPKLIAEALNNYFVNVGKQTSSNIPPTNKSFRDYLPNHNVPDFEFRTVTSTEIEEIINSLQAKSSSGLDGINSILLKFLKNELKEPLAVVANQMITTCRFPSKLKIAKVLPIFKKGEDDKCENYRPISLLPAISKVFEKILLRQMDAHFKLYDLYFCGQYGFRKNRSTEHAILEVCDRILQDMDKKKTPVSIFLDLSKAFDCLDHKILLSKLKYYGIKNKSLSLCSNYLSNRTQFVELNTDNSSEKLSIDTGVPQGSILGPFFFLLYVNDFNKCTKKFNMINYADDTTLLTTLTCENNINVAEKINEELNHVFIWLCTNKLSLNVSKTKFMTFHRPQKSISSPVLKINHKEIQETDEFNLLGVTIDKTLNFRPHITKITNKISKTCGILNKLKRIIPRRILIQIYNALIAPHLNYGILAWSHSTLPITQIQKKVIRTITCSKYNAHTEPLFKRLNILKFEDLRNLNRLKFFHKFINNCLPEYFLTNYIMRNRDIHGINTRNLNRLIIPQHSHQFYKTGLRYSIVTTVNSTPDELLNLCETHSLKAFVHRLKQSFLNRYEIACNVINCYICNPVTINP